MSEEGLVQAHVYIAGRVQGVNFRFYTRQAAFDLGVSGWVRNTRDGRVEAVFQGQEEHVAKIIKWCERGPTAAHVDHLEVEWEEPLETFSSFEIRYWGG